MPIELNNNFTNLEADLASITNRFFSNQNLLKLLYYNDADALKKPDINDGDTLIQMSKENIKITPLVTIPSQKNSFIIITFDNFEPNLTNPEFMDSSIFIDVLCPNEERVWMMDDYMLRPFRIVKEINALMDKSRLAGIGIVNFEGASLMNLGDYAGYKLIYSVINNV